jgi:hypothetical protein
MSAVGLVAKTGWAVAVVLDGSAADPVVVDRRRLDLLQPGTPGHVYHAAADLEPGPAEALVAHVHKEALEGARRGLAALTEEHAVAAVGLVAASGHVPDDLAAIFASHTLLHAAEGELVREALSEAAAAADLPVVRHRKKEFVATAQRVLGLAEDEVRARLALLGQGLGAPWRQEQKDAALAAWLTIAG